MPTPLVAAPGRLQAAQRPCAARRRWSIATLAALATAGLAACGGGDDAPRIERFDAVGAALVGERAAMTATFSGGSGRVEPEIGTVRSGEPFDSAVLDRERSYTLVVESPGRPAARRTLTLTPRFRDRHVVQPAGLGVQAFAAVALADGTPLLVGGSRGGPAMSTSVDRWDPALQRFRTIAHLEHGRAGHQAVRLLAGPHAGRVLVVGGYAGLPEQSPAELVDPQTGAVGASGTPVRVRYEHALVALRDGRALVVGGIGRDDLEIWDPASGQFRVVAARMRHERRMPAAAQLADGRVLIAGGLHDGAVDVPAELFDPATETFLPVTSVADERRYGDRAHLLSDGQVLLVGGEQQQQGEPRPAATALRYDPQARTLVRDRAYPVPLARAASVLLPDDRVLLFGGQTPAEAASAGTLSFGRDAVRTLAPMPQPRRLHAALRLADGRILLFGGDDGHFEAVTPVLVYD